MWRSRFNVLLSFRLRCLYRKWTDFDLSDKPNGPTKIKVSSNLSRILLSVSFSFSHLSLLAGWPEIKFIYCFQHSFMVFIWWFHRLLFILNAHGLASAFAHKALILIDVYNVYATVVRLYRFRSFSLLFGIVFGKNRNKLFIRCPFFYSIQCFCLFHATSVFVISAATHIGIVFAISPCCRPFVFLLQLSGCLKPFAPFFNFVLFFLWSSP